MSVLDILADTAAVLWFAAKLTFAAGVVMAVVFIAWDAIKNLHFTKD